MNESPLIFSEEKKLILNPKSVCAGNGHYYYKVEHKSQLFLAIYHFFFKKRKYFF